MGKFESSLGTKNFTATELREFDVPDESGYKQYGEQSNFDQEMPAELELELKALKQKRANAGRINDGAKRRLEVLMGMSRTTRTVDIDGNSFTFQSIKAKEMREAILAAAKYDNIQSSFEIRRQFIARSLIVIAGVDFEQFIGSNLLNDKLDFIEELDESLLSRMYEEYLIMAADSRKKFSITTESEIQEVVSDLKK